MCSKWGSTGFGNGQFNNLKAIAVDSAGNVFVTELGLGNSHSRIQKFTNDGKFITKWGSLCILHTVGYLKYEGCIDPDGKGPLSVGDGQFYNAQGIAVDSAGNVYVVDQNNDRIQKFTNDGKFITKWGSPCYSPLPNQIYYGSCPNPSPSEFMGPDGGIAVDSAGNVYVVDQNNDRIQKFTNDGKFITNWGSRGTGDGMFDGPSLGPSGIAIDHRGYVYTTMGNDKIQVFAPAVFEFIQ
jgi:sugar lactone lactonase YvrE